MVTGGPVASVVEIDAAVDQVEKASPQFRVESLLIRRKRGSLFIGSVYGLGCADGYGNHQEHRGERTLDVHARHSFCHWSVSVANSTRHWHGQRTADTGQRRL